HGEGVAIGMVAAARIADRMGRADPGLADRIAAVLEVVGLPTRCPPWPVEQVWGAMRHDKKRQGERLHWVLPAAIGQVDLADDVPDALVTEVLMGMGAGAEQLT
ncbi:MAG: 3-dehydroquinate synthase, partial [Anaerolineae bacterium]|nr:3-dehydroquinate synthase [Anaerolineae bacterium]